MSELSEKIAKGTTGAKGGIPRKRAHIRPRHRAVLARMQSGMSISASMIASGYTPATAHQTDKLQKSLSWQALMEEHIPESLLTLRHNELLNKRESEVRVLGRGANERVEIVDLGPDVQAVKAGLEMGYRLRGRFRDEVKPSDKPTQVYNLFYQPNVQASIRTFEDSLKEAITNGDISKVIDAPATEPSADGGGDIAGGGAPDAPLGDADAIAGSGAEGDGPKE